MKRNQQNLIVAVVGTVVVAACLSSQAQAGGFKFSKEGGGNKGFSFSIGNGKHQFHINHNNHKQAWNNNQKWTPKQVVKHISHPHWNHYHNYSGFCSAPYGGCNYHNYCFTPVAPVVVVEQPRVQIITTGGAPLNIANGTWTARPAANVAIVVTFVSDSQFAWKQTIDGKSNDFAGTYSLQDDLLTLSRDDNQQKLAGNVTVTASGFNFKLQNGDPQDPGLAFTR